MLGFVALVITCQIIETDGGKPRRIGGATHLNMSALLSQMGRYAFCTSTCDVTNILLDMMKRCNMHNLLH